MKDNDLAHHHGEHQFLFLFDEMLYKSKMHSVHNSATQFQSLIVIGHNEVAIFVKGG